MLSDLSLLTKSDNFNLRHHYKKLDLGLIACSVCKELQTVAKNKNIKIICQICQKEIQIIGHKDDFEKLLLNLVSNAIKYNKTNGWIKINAKKTEKGIVLTVTDGGIGIPQKELANIFERFYRIDKARTRKEGGSGLGLAICRHIAEQYGGKITVKSTEGKGSTFSVFFPITK